MKLTLKNFRCYLDKEFDFGSEGVVLLSGPSGAGKSTVMIAILFALYGKGTNIVTFGQTSCQVIIEFDRPINNRLRISRKRRPNYLLVENLDSKESWEDDAAQAVINDRFGAAFETTSYVQQNAYNSFILMSPMDKLEFIEKFALTGIDISQIKERCQKTIRQRNDELTSCTSQLELAQQEVAKMVKPTKVSFPIKTDDRDAAIAKNEQKLANLTKKLHKTEQEIARLHQEQKAVYVLETKRDNINGQITKIQHSLDELNNEKDAIKYIGDDNLSKLEQQLTELISRREVIILEERYEEDKKRYEELLQTEQNDWTKEIATINKTIWSEYQPKEIDTTIKEFTELIRDLKEKQRLVKQSGKYKIDSDKLHRDKKTLQQLQITLRDKKELQHKLQLQKNMYSCPNCDATLQFKNNQLCLCDSDIIEDERLDVVEAEIKSLTTRINQLEYSTREEDMMLEQYNKLLAEIKTIDDSYEQDGLPSITEAEDEIEKLTKYRQAQQELERRRKKLEDNLANKTYSATVETLKNQLVKLAGQIKSKRTAEKKIDADEIDEELLRSKINRQREYRQRIGEILRQTKLLQRDLALQQEELNQIVTEHRNVFGPARSRETVDSELIEAESSLAELKKGLELRQKVSQRIREYQQYKKELALYQDWQSRVENLTAEEKKHRQRYAAAMKLKDLIGVSEGIAITNVINSINAHAQEYLEEFFTADPIHVHLSPFKQTKKNTSKPQIDVEVTYKGMEGKLDTLSGGETSRVILAYTLALAEIFNTPLILLDECTASLDQESTSVVMEAIRKNFTNKLVIVIAHQVVSGDFDHQIKL